MGIVCARVCTFFADGRPSLHPTISERADELRRLNPQRQVLLVRPYQPISVDKIFYYSDSFFEGMHDSNPYLTPLETLAS